MAKTHYHNTGDKGGLHAKVTHLTTINLTNCGHSGLLYATVSTERALVFVGKPNSKNLPSSRHRNCQHRSCIQLKLIYLKNNQQFIHSKLPSTATQACKKADQNSSHFHREQVQISLLPRRSHTSQHLYPVEETWHSVHITTACKSSTAALAHNTTFIMWRKHGNLFTSRQPVKPARQP